MRRIVIDALVALGLIALFQQTYTELDAELHMHAGDKYLLSKLYDLAAVQFQEAERITPDRYEAFRSLADASLKSYDPAGQNLRPLFVAEWALNQAVGLNPLYPYGWDELGEVAFRLNLAHAPDSPNPEKYFRRALEIDPANPRFLAGLMRWQLAFKMWVEAWETFERLIGSDPGAIRAYGDRFLRTEADVNRLAHMIRGNTAQAVQLGYLLNVRGDYARAGELIRGLPAEKQLEPEAASLLASALRQQGRMDEAEKVLRGALARDPENLSLARDLGWLLVFAKKDREAIDWFGGVLAQNPGAYTFALEAANAASNLGEWSHAAQWYELALAANKLNDTGARDALVGLSEARRKQGQFRSALIAARQLIDLDPDNHRYKEMVDRLQLELERQQESAAGWEEKP